MIRPLIFLILVTTSSLHAQPFWTKTTFSPTSASGTTDIAVSPVTGKIFVSTASKGVYYNDDTIGTWTQGTVDTAIFCLNARADGMVVAGGIGCVYITLNDGDTWTRKNISSAWPVRDIVFNSEGGIFITTADVEDVGGTGYFRGDGVFFSDDDGQTWEQRNNGISGSKASWNIAITAQDELIVAMADDRSGQAVGGIYYSTNAGLNWTKINFKTTDGTFQYENIAVTNIFDLMTGSGDTIFIMLEGIYTNYEVSFNARLSMTDIKQSGVWQIFSAFDSVPNPVIQSEFSKMFRQSNGALWGSMSGLGIFYSAGLAHSFTRKNSGINPMYYSGPQPRYLTCRMAEYSDGTVLMIQTDDTAVYKADSSRLFTAIAPVAPVISGAKIFPNPTENNIEITFLLTQPSLIELSIYDVKGTMLRTLYSGNCSTEKQRIPVMLTESAGIYFIRLKTATEELFLPISKL